MHKKTLTPVKQEKNHLILDNSCYLNNRHTGSTILVQRAKILRHTPEVQRSLARQTKELANIQEPKCFRRVYPKTFGFQANQFHKLWVSRGRSPQTSMFQKGLPQNLRVPSEPVPQTLGFSILESGCRFFRRHSPADIQSWGT
ncbi:hypothetical protein YC2023_117097 [Brassica napus]